MLVAGRRSELDEAGRLLERARRGSGGLLVLCGPAGSGKTTIAEAVAATASDGGLEVLWARPAERLPGLLPWAQLLRDTAAPDCLADRLLAPDRGPLDLDGAAAHLMSGGPRLIVIDDIDRGGPDAIAMLSVVAARCLATSVAVMATTSSPLGMGTELRLAGLSEQELAAALDEPEPDIARALWLASRGLPGVAVRLVRNLADRPSHNDPVTELALTATSAEVFLEVDTSLVRLLEIAAGRARDDVTRCRVLARLARELLGDASAAARRRALADEALDLARRAGDPAALADVLDSRLHALWDQRGAEDRLAAGSEIIDLARASGDGKRERQGMFWRFVALMELGRIAEAESALAAFAREAEVAGDAEGRVLVTARHAMLAVMRGRFDQASELAEDIRQAAERAGLPDAEMIAMTLRASVAFELGLEHGEWPRAPDLLLATARKRPGHLFEATAARALVALGRIEEAAAELDRVLPRALASSGPRWLGAMTDLAVVAAAVGDLDAASRIYQALAPYRDRLVVWGGAASVWGPVSHYLGLLAASMGRAEEAAAHFADAIASEERAGALPYLAHSLAGLAAVSETLGDAGQAAAAAQRSRDLATRLGMTVLLRRLGPPSSDWSLTRDGDDWLLAAGDERARLRDGRGLHYLRALIAAPGKDIRALDLAAGGGGLVTTAIGPVLDASARAAYRRRLASLEAALDAADRAGDREAALRAEAERGTLVRELRAATGLGRRDRDASPEAERARVNVTRTLRAAIDRIAVTAPRAAAHLTASVHTGGACRYDPAPGGPDRWIV